MSKTNSKHNYLFYIFSAVSIAAITIMVWSAMLHFQNSDMPDKNAGGNAVATKFATAIKTGDLAIVQQCLDSDALSADQYKVAGYVIDYESGVSVTVNDYCSNPTTVMEQYCSTNNARAQQAYACTNGDWCFRGRCVAPCYDSDNGNFEHIPGYVIVNDTFQYNDTGIRSYTTSPVQDYVREQSCLGAPPSRNARTEQSIPCYQGTRFQSQNGLAYCPTS